MTTLKICGYENEKVLAVFLNTARKRGEKSDEDKEKNNGVITYMKKKADAKYMHEKIR